MEYQGLCLHVRQELRLRNLASHLIHDHLVLRIPILHLDIELGQMELTEKTVRHPDHRGLVPIPNIELGRMELTEKTVRRPSI